MNVVGLIDHDCVLGNGFQILMGAVGRYELVLPEKHGLLPIRWRSANLSVYFFYENGKMKLMTRT